MTFEITSTSNPRIRRLIQLQQRRHRDREGVFIVEGNRLLNRAVDAGLTPLEVYVDGSVDADWEDVISVHPDVLDRASYRKRSEGVIAVFSQFTTDLDDITLHDPALILAVEGLEKPGNLGAVLRTADAVGADVVLTVGNPIDLFNPNVLRASTGAAFTVPVVDTDLPELRTWLAAHSIDLIVADGTAPLSIWDADLTGGVTLMVGREDEGLSPTARALASRVVSIPMLGSVDSLNASVALSLFAYEALRQRT